MGYKLTTENEFGVDINEFTTLDAALEAGKKAILNDADENGGVSTLTFTIEAV